MAVVMEKITISGHEFTHTYSDAGKYVVRDGVSYEEAYDPAHISRTYTEGEMITRDSDGVPDDMELSDDQLVNILTGGII